MNDHTRIFVFGSNLKGIHGKGAALDAARNWGAIRYKGQGLQGRAYAIPTKDRAIKTLPLPQIQEHVRTFITFAESHPELLFLVTRIGCGLAGYKDEEIAPFFKDAPSNCEFDPQWATWGLRTWTTNP